MVQLANFVDERLEDHLNLYIEYSNEVWNPSFTQNEWVYQQSKNKTSEFVEEYFLYHEYAARTINMLEIFEQNFDNPERVIGVLSAQAAWDYPLVAGLELVDAMGKIDLVDAIAVAPYFGLNLETENKAVDLSVAALEDGIVTDEEYTEIFNAIRRVIEGTFSPDTEEGAALLHQKEMADAHGLPLITYEAGQHFVSWWHPELGDFPVNLNQRPEMYDLYLYYLDNWRNIGGGSITMYHLAGGWFGEEAFGHLQTYNMPLNEAHKFRALLNWLEMTSSEVLSGE